MEDVNLAQGLLMPLTELQQLTRLSYTGLVIIGHRLIKDLEFTRAVSHILYDCLVKAATTRHVIKVLLFDKLDSIYGGCISPFKCLLALRHAARRTPWHCV